ncbi:hypothetical protein ACFIOY_19630 [Bradyrhizobium sp. TZ2]
MDVGRAAQLMAQADGVAAVFGFDVQKIDLKKGKGTTSPVESW